MIVERLVFHAKYGKGDELVAIGKEADKLFAGAGMPPARILTDYTGTMFRMIIETEYPDVATWARLDEKAMQAPGFGAWFARMQPLVERGERELLRVVD